MCFCLCVCDLWFGCYGFFGFFFVDGGMWGFVVFVGGKGIVVVYVDL